MSYSNVLRRFEERNKRMRRLRASGLTLKRLAKMYGLSKTRVAQIVGKNGA